MKVKVCVTQDHIDEGEVYSTYSCPIALALKEQFKSDDVSVGDLSFYSGAVYRCISIGDVAVKIPKAAATFIKKFDDGKTVEPFTFTL